MRRWVLTGLLFIMALEIAAPAFAARHVRVVHHGPRGTRSTVVVHRNFPVRRALPVVVVRPARTRVVVAPAVFLAPVIWTAAVVTTPPARSALVWEDAETLTQDDDWTEFTLGANRKGRKLYVEIVGKAQLSFAEVVFANGETRVVDFEDKPRDSGLYALLDFADGRKIAHVRMVARARSDEARIVLRMS